VVVGAEECYGCGGGCSGAGKLAAVEMDRWDAAMVECVREVSPVRMQRSMGSVWARLRERAPRSRTPQQLPAASRDRRLGCQMIDLLHACSLEGCMEAGPCAIAPTFPS